jgi:hypothetical protein
MDTRPVEHVAQPAFLQNHSLMRHGFDLTEPDVFDQYLRFSALFSRGLVVVDSDLNNNQVFHRAAEREDGLFWAGLRTGFIRRAVRTDEAGHVFTQSDVAEGLRKSSRWRFDLIPEGYTTRLDRALARSEAENPPLLWTRRAVNWASGGKILGLLGAAAADRTRESAERRVIDAIASWVLDRRAHDEEIGAADVESQVRPGLGSSERSAWDAVWPIVLQAHTGNIPLTFGGRLAVTGLPEAGDRLLPAGPESGPEESAIEAALYADAGGEWDVELKVRRVRSRLPSWNVRTDRLAELSLEQVEELREAAEPGEFLTARFSTAGSAEAMASGLEELRDTTITFMERLVSAGAGLTRETERSVLRSQSHLWAPFDRDHSEAELIAVAKTRDRIVEYTMMHSFPWPGGGTQELGCDFTTLAGRLQREKLEAFFRSEIGMYWRYKRPDFRVFELMAKGDWG